MMPLRSLRRFFRGDSLPNPFSRITLAYLQAKQIVRLYYAATLYLVSDRYLALYERWAQRDASDFSMLEWPVEWVAWTGMETAAYGICVLLILGAALSMMLPQKRLFRLLVFVGLLLSMALENSQVKINHNMHAWLAISFCFLFLPMETSSSKRVDRLTYLNTFWYCQGLVLFFFTMAGAWKIYMGFVQMQAGEIHAFHPYAMGQQIAELICRGHEPILGPFIIENPYLCWPLYLSALYLEFFAFVAAFRPSMHRLWGISLALFHIGTFFAMDIKFDESVLALGLILVASPFHPVGLRWQTIARDLPVVGLLLRRFIPPPK